MYHVVQMTCLTCHILVRQACVYACTILSDVVDRNMFNALEDADQA